MESAREGAIKQAPGCRKLVLSTHSPPYTNELPELLHSLRPGDHLFYHVSTRLSHMSSVLQNPLVHYGMPLLSASVIVLVAFAFLDGTMQLVAFGMAALEILVAPQIIQRAG